MESVVVAALYKFVTLEDYHELREPLLDVCVTAGVRGTLLLAREGINGTIAGSRQGVDDVIAYLRNDSRLADLDHKESCDDHVPFYRMKVKLKKEIVTMGVTGIDPNTRAGTYVSPRDWNDLISDPEVFVIDTRNDYECDIGGFSGAVDPRTQNFREFPEFVRTNLDPDKQKKVAILLLFSRRESIRSIFVLRRNSNPPQLDSLSVDGLLRIWNHSSISKVRIFIF